MEQQRQELINYLAIIEEKFNPNDVLTLQALLYLFYSNYTIWNNEDEVFTQKLLSLVEKCHLEDNHDNPMEMQDCPMCEPCMPEPSGFIPGGPHPCGWAHDPYDMPRTLRSELVAAGARALFFNGEPAKRLRME